MTIQSGSRTDGRAPAHAVPGHGMPAFAYRKLVPPRFPPDLVGRARQQRWLDTLARHEVAIVRAPPGYGKTAFCGALFEQALAAGWFAGWVSFDAEDNEPAAGGHLLRAVRLAHGDDATGDDSAAAISPAIITNMIAEQIDARPAPLLLILDDVDRLTDPKALEVLDRLLRHPPAQLRLVLASRDVPMVRMDDADGRGMVLRLGQAEIGLTDDEARDFLHAAGSKLDQAAYKKLNGLLRGWPLGLRMAAQRQDRIAQDDWGSLIAQMRTYLRPLFEDRHPDTFKFLSRSSIAPRLNGELVQLLGEQDCGIPILEDLHAQGLFVDRSTDGNDWYDVHPAVRAIFRQHLDEGEPERAAELHRVAGRYYEAQGLPAEAIDQFLAAGAHAEAARMIADHAPLFLGSGNIECLAAWLNTLPRAQIANRPALVRAAAWLSALTAHARSEAAIADLEAAGETAEARAIELFHAGHARDQIDRIAEEGDRLLALQDELSDFAADMIRTVVAHGAQRRGLFGLVHDVVRPLRLRSAAPATGLPRALASRTRAAVARAQGQLAEAERLLRDGRIAEPHGLPGALIDAALARSCYERDDLDGAADLAASALPWLEPSCFQDAVIQAFQISIRVAAAQERPAEAATLIDRAELIAFERDWAPLKAMCVVERARLRLPPTIDAEAVVAVADEDAAVRDPLSAAARAFALLSEMRAYEAIAAGDRPRLTTVAERLLQLAANADDAELRASATLFNILPQLSGRCDKMVALEIVRFLNHAASTGFRRTIVDVLDVTGVRAVQNFCSEAYSSDSFLALLKLADPSRRDHRLEGHHGTAPGEEFSFLTEREIDILGALKAGESNKEIARTLNLAPETVKWHLKNVMRKLRAASRDEAVQNAATLGLRMTEAG